MLVLSRKNGQKIIINDDIEITILESRFDHCKIAIEAPKSVKIYREEVYKQIQFANTMSNKTSLESLDSLTSLMQAQNDIMPEKTNKIFIKKK
ncbi:MAG TPA: carbon storage regulator CsrA [Candidatus Gastranaerophilaceae bacterium]|nr:carbon storage regulator CsrA [Candidatus Gastranaerophilaceae bacterium]HPT41844.1 carbon storage regulator CsrA [Candidatus Gastranaerophilaceae bacterium]